MTLENLRAICVSVDYEDIHAITLPRMRKHFKEYWIVTATGQKATIELANAHDCRLLITSAFYEDGAVFNKWRALEQGYDAMGRHSWLCNLDADVIWPEKIEWPDALVPGMLCTPLRRMMPYESMRSWMRGTKFVMPGEEVWRQYPIHRNVNEWAGYSQIFHASDPRLGKPPWHGINNSHAGSEDSWFQARWPRELKIRPTWECLHLGAAGENWMGRASVRLDGSVPADRDRKLAEIRKMWAQRAARRSKGLDPFQPERLRP